MGLDIKGSKSRLIESLSSKRSEKTADSSNRDSDNAMRGEPMLELVREKPENFENFKFNDMTDYDIDYAPGVVFEELNNFNDNIYEKKLNIELNAEKKWIKIHQEGTEELLPLKVKVKFFNVTDKKENEDDDDPTPRYRLRMVKQLGDLQQWYEILDKMK